MKNTSFQHVICAIVLWACLFCVTACVNSVESDIVTEGDIPISFSVDIKKSSTKVANNLFEDGDKVGLYSVLSGGSIADVRYINNLRLVADGNNTLIPKKPVFYPEGDGVALDFISYYPYQEEGAPKGSSQILLSVHSDQSDKAKYSESDFLVAKKQDVCGSNEPVKLTFKHQLVKLKLVLVPGKDENLDDILAANPRIVVTGLYTQAQYDLELDAITELAKQEDILPSGEWKKQDGKLMGKELIVIPQNIGDEQMLQMEWNGRIYSCRLPIQGEVESNTQYVIEISTTQSDSFLLNSMVAKIEDWALTEEKNTENEGEIDGLHISVLSFAESNVYNVYFEGHVIAEICKEYLKSSDVTSSAIVSYPVIGDERADLSRGTVLRLLDMPSEKAGGTVSWNAEDNKLTYTAGKLSEVNAVYFDKQGNVLFECPESPIRVNVMANTIRDLRDGLVEYPIVKIGTQYWMRSNLKATSDNNGEPIPHLKEQGSEKGVFIADGGERFYNGYVLESMELAPDGWQIPSRKDWDKLLAYVDNDACALKVGTWKGKSDQEAVENTNHSMFSVLPVGVWSEKKVYSEGNSCGFWTWDYEKEGLPEYTIFFTGEQSEVIWASVKASFNELWYKVLSVRCLRKE